MKAIEREAGVLEVRSSPWGLRLFGLPFFAIGLTTAYLFLTATSLRCERDAGRAVRCTRESQLFGVSFSSKPAGDVTGVTVMSETDDEGTTLYRAELETTLGWIPISSVWASDDRSRIESARRVERFLASGELHSERLDAESPVFLIFPIAFTAVGAAMIFFPRGARLTIDRRRGVVTLTRSGLMFQRATERPFASLRDAKSSASGGRGTVELSFDEGRVSVPCYAGGHEACELVAGRIRLFLGLAVSDSRAA